LTGIGVATAGLFLPPAATTGQSKDPLRQLPIQVPLKVQPALLYDLPERIEARTWRSWGGVQTVQAVSAEKDRIQREMALMKTAADFPLEILPVVAVRTTDEAAVVAKGAHDMTLVYAAGGRLAELEALTSPEKRNLIFLRHRSGPVYRWYLPAHARYLRKNVDEFSQPGMGTEDVVVDSHDEVLWRLRALYGLKNTLGKRIVAVGGPSGWGRDYKLAPERACKVWKLDIQTLSYPDLGDRIKRARQNEALLKRCSSQAERYLKQKGISLETSRQFVSNSFILTEVLRGLLDDFHTDAITINGCMTTIMPISETTACLPLSILNDDGYMAFCESDFVVIPSGILLHYISSKPQFLNDPCYPHDGLVTLAHCTAPRKMDGNNLERARILTHFESDYGAAPKVEMRKGQKVTNIAPDFAVRKYVGVEGEIVDTPFLPICRSQIEVQIKGDMDRLLQELRGFHWMTCYGDYLREVGYALKKTGLDWIKV
jgi:hypothetical protein